MVVSRAPSPTCKGGVAAYQPRGPALRRNSGQGNFTFHAAANSFEDSVVDLKKSDGHLQVAAELMLTERLVGPSAPPLALELSSHSAQQILQVRKTTTSQKWKSSRKAGESALMSAAEIAKTHWRQRFSAHCRVETSTLEYV